MQGEVVDAAIKIQNSIRKRIAARTVEKKRSEFAQSKAKQAEIELEKERQLLRKKKREKTAEEELAARKDKAAGKIQGVFRVKKARNEAEKKNDIQIEERGAVALCKEPGFVQIAADFLMNTMYNIIQEAAHEEFVIESEPLKFVIKRDFF